MTIEQSRNLRIATLSFLLVAIPLIAYVIRYKIAAPLYFFNDDSFYYLDIAKNSLGAHGFTFDRVNQANGFHPLWEWTLYAAARLHLIDFSHRISTLIRVYYLNVMLLSFGASIFAVAGSRYLRLPSLAILTVAPGLFWIFASAIEPGFYATWTFANGMESALALFCFAIAFLLIREDDVSPLPLTFISLWLGLAILSRLDDIFISLSVAAYLLWKTPAANRLTRLFAFSPLALLVGAYLIYNIIHIGAPLPLSGITKSGLAIGANIKNTVRLFLPVVTGAPPSWYPNDYGVYSDLTEIGGRTLQMVLPAVLCFAELIIVFRSGSLRTFNALHALCIGVVLKALYNFCFVGSVMHQGQWYYTVSIFVANLVMVLWLSRLIGRLAPTGVPSSVRRLCYVLFFAFSLASCNIIFIRKNEDGPANHVRLLLNSDSFNAKMRSLDADKYIEFDDGFLGFISDAPSMGGLGLVLDKEGSLAFKNGTLLDLAYHRGYRTLVTSDIYARSVLRDLDSRRTDPNKEILTIHSQELNHYRIIPEGQDGTDSGVFFYRFEPISPTPTTN